MKTLNKVKGEFIEKQEGAIGSLHENSKLGWGEHMEKQEGAIGNLHKNS